MNRAKRFVQKRKRKQMSETGSKGRFKRGFYKPLNEEKYKQPFDNYMNKGEFPEYRSSWELKLMKYLDNSNEVEYWTAEPFHIPYISPKDGKQHRYFPDFLVKFKDGRKVLIEVKPQSQWGDPINRAKWEQAKKFCEEHLMEWRVMGEKELGV